MAGWQDIARDTHGDWLKQRRAGLGSYITLGDKKTDGLRLFDSFSLGVVTNGDAWCYNSSRAKLTTNMTRMIEV